MWNGKAILILLVNEWKTPKVNFREDKFSRIRDVQIFREEIFFANLGKIREIRENKSSRKLILLR